MNEVRREALAKIRVGLLDLRAELETLRDQEQGYYDNLPASWQRRSNKGVAAAEAWNALGEAADHVAGGD